MAHFVYPAFYETGPIENIILGGYHRFMPGYPNEAYLVCVFLYILDIPFFEYLYTARHFHKDVKKVYKFQRFPWQNNIQAVLYDNWYGEEDRLLANKFMFFQFICFCGNRKFLFYYARLFVHESRLCLTDRCVHDRHTLLNVPRSISARSRILPKR